jgi:hypothetical protein
MHLTGCPLDDQHLNDRLGLHNVPHRWETWHQSGPIGADFLPIPSRPLPFPILLLWSLKTR